MSYDTAAPYAACCTILRRGNTIAFILRQNTDWMNDYYSLPAGKLERGEMPIVGAVREAKEEAGVTIDPSDMSHLITVYRQTEDLEMDWVDFYFEAQEWQGEPYNAEPNMHSELRWLDINELPDNVIPAQAHALKQISMEQRYTEFVTPPVTS